MSLPHHLVYSFWHQAERLDAKGRARARTARRRRTALQRQQVQLEQRVDELEEDLERVTLLLRALADVCVRKGIVTKDELAAVARELDAEDGVVDGRSSPDLLDDPGAPPA